MRKIIVVVFIILLSIGIFILSKNSSSSKNTDAHSVTKTIDNSKDFVDPFALKDPPYSRAENPNSNQ